MLRTVSLLDEKPMECPSFPVRRSANYAQRFTGLQGENAAESIKIY
jgi:hypothetical protein